MSLKKWKIIQANFTICCLHKSVQMRVNNSSWWKGIWLCLLSPTKTMTRYHSATTILILQKTIFKLQVWLVPLLEASRKKPDTSTKKEPPHFHNTSTKKKNQMSWHPVVQELIPRFWSNPGFHISEWGDGGGGVGEERGKPLWRVALIQTGEWL